MAGGPVFYKQNRRIFPKIWQRHLAAGIIFAAVCHIGWRYHVLSVERYDTFRGRTAMYGPDTVRGGQQQ